jgi:hypothetical protein
MVIVGIDVRGGWPGSRTEKPTRRRSVWTFDLQNIDGGSFGLEQERGIGSQVNVVGDTDIFEQTISEPVADCDEGSARGIERVSDGLPRCPGAGRMSA